jgi:ABC-2 type transport system permease protein
MSGRRILALFRRVVQEIRRDRPSIGLLFIAPILMSGLVTFILREGETPEVDAVIVSPGGPAGEQVAKALGEALHRSGASVTEAADEASARDLIEARTASVAIVLPASLPTSGSPTITVITDGIDPVGDASQLTAIQQSLFSAASAVSGSSLPTIQHATLYGTPSDDPITSFAPAIVGFFAYFFVYVLTGVSFLRERTGGTLERLMATPVMRGEIVIGYTLGFGIFATVQVAVLLAWTLGSVSVPASGPLPPFAVGLGVALAGSPLVAFLVVLLLAVGAVSLGIFLSTFARTELQIVQFIPLVIAPQFLLSGVLFPVSSLPAVLQPIAAVMPLSYAVDGLRHVFVRGADLGVPALQTDLAMLALFAAFFATIASFTIRRDVV